MARKLEGRRALITDASSGIGEAVSRALAREGARTVLVARRRDRLEEVSASIEASEVIAAGVADEEAVDDLRRTVQEGGPSTSSSTTPGWGSTGRSTPTRPRNTTG